MSDNAARDIFASGGWPRTFALEFGTVLLSVLELYAAEIPLRFDSNARKYRP